MKGNVFFTKEYVQSIKNTSDNGRSNLLEALLKLCEQALETKSYTEDERYFEKARELMLTVASYKKWWGKGWSQNGCRGERIYGRYFI